MSLIFQELSQIVLLNSFWGGIGDSDIKSTNNIGRLWIWDFLRKEGVLPHFDIAVRISPKSEGCKDGVIDIKDLTQSTFVRKLSSFGS